MWCKKKNDRKARVRYRSVQHKTHVKSIYIIHRASGYTHPERIEKKRRAIKGHVPHVSKSVGGRTPNGEPPNNTKKR